ncbi:serine--tRNA ligase [Dermatobacter hominis]|uniref:serine--tRNA ligase n=1 Tax=Dermatobacter hominis TaxID=2884263 RepID=UPI001D129A26|nr:serine--tRNA ligase [Dermatobacter hominis]UDY34063.1 serine--tRNA ligase [Dermatobacter hominis]
MLDVRLIRNDPDAVKAGLSRRGEDPAAIDEVAGLDAELRNLTVRRDGLRAEIRTLSNEVGTLFREQRQDEAKELQEQSRILGAEEKALDAGAEDLAAELREKLLRIPNLPSEDAPDGSGEDDNVVVRVERFDADSYGEHQRVPHWEIGEELGILDVERAVKLSGSMFVMYRGAGATLVRALCQLALDRNVDLYEEIRPPTLVRTDTMISTGHLPKFEDEAYHIERDDLWAIPTAEVPLTSLGRDEIVDEADLPRRYCAHTSCFRREAGSAGKDTRGLLRVHEFDKVEILAYSTPEQAPDLHAEILARAEGTIRDLGLTYRILDLCAGDLGASSKRTFDIEVYAPGADRWLEVSSVSWFGDYQARRANLRYRPAEGKGTEILHTLNGSALAVPRVWAAIVETYRRPDGTIEVPELLLPYFRGRTHIG